MRRWVAGELSWDDGRTSGAVTVTGSVAGWSRMLLATGYPARPTDLAERIRRDLHGPRVAQATSQVPARVFKCSASLSSAMFHPIAPGESAGIPAWVMTILVRSPRSSSSTVISVVVG